MKDIHFLILSVSALVIHLGVFSLPLMGILVRPALAVLTALTALGVILVLVFETRAFDTATTSLLIVEILALGIAAWALLSPSTPGMWCLGIATSLHVLLLLVLLALLTLFKMDRLW